MKIKKIIIMILFIAGLALIGYGFFSTFSKHSSNSDTPVEKKEEETPAIHFEKMENETYEEAFRRFCFEFTKKDECKTADIEVIDDFYSIVVPQDEDYDQSFSYNFSLNDYTSGVILKNESKFDYSKSNGGK